METEVAVSALSALAHEGRLRVLRMLIVSGEAGMAAGEIARAAGMLPNTLSSNLNILSGAGLLRSRREGRSIIYTAAYDRMNALLEFLMKDCCDGRPEILDGVICTAGGACSPVEVCAA